MTQLIQIRKFLVRLPDPLYPYQGKSLIGVRRAVVAASPDTGWVPLTALVGRFFQPAFGRRNPLNIPGPFYGAETDTCLTGPMEAPHNVLSDGSGQEFVFSQPGSEGELRDVLSAAICECFVGYGADGDEHWTVALIREWWRSRHDLLDLKTHATGLSESRLRWERCLAGEGEAYLRAYAFFVDNRRLPGAADFLPEVESS